MTKKASKFEFIDTDRLVFNGEVVVTDPCYLVPDGYWVNFIDAMMAGPLLPCMVKINDAVMLVCSAAYGDGCYDADGQSFGVDSGMICVMHTSDLASLRWKNPGNPRAATLNVSGLVIADRGGNFSGAIVVDTASDEEEVLSHDH